MPDCEEMLGLISAKLDGMLSAEQEAALEGHLAGCPACRALQADFEALHAALGEAAARPVPPPPDLLEGVLAQIRAGQASPNPKRRARPWRSWAAMAAVFAVVAAGAAGMKFFGAGGSGGAGAAPAAPPQGTPGQFTAAAPPAEAVQARAAEPSAETAEPRIPSNDSPAAADTGAPTGAAPSTPPQASPSPPVGILPQAVLHNEVAPGAGGVTAYHEQAAAPEGTLYCGVMTIAWTEDLDLSALDGLPYTQTLGTRDYLVSAAEFEALAQIYAGLPGASLIREGEGISPTSGQGLFSVCDVPGAGEDGAPASPAP